MDVVVKVLIALVAVIHLYIFWFEMFAWESRGKRVFKNFPPALFAQTKALAANMGLYNGFLAAGLLWTFAIDDMLWQRNVALFFLSCVAVAGIYGGLRAERRIFFVQALPALVALALILCQ